MIKRFAGLALAAILLSAIVVIVPRASADCPPSAPAPSGGGQVVGFFEFIDPPADQNNTEPLLPDPGTSHTKVPPGTAGTGANPSVGTDSPTVDTNCAKNSHLNGPGPSGLPVNPGVTVVADTGLDQCTPNKYLFSGVLLNGVSFSHDGHAFAGSISTSVGTPQVPGKTFCDSDGTGRDDNIDGSVPTSNFQGGDCLTSCSFGTYHGWFNATGGAFLTVNLTYDAITICDVRGCSQTYSGVPLQLSVSLAIPVGTPGASLSVCSDAHANPNSIKELCLQGGSFIGQFAYPNGPGGNGVTFPPNDGVQALP